MRNLEENEFLKLAEITGISSFDIQKLYNMGLLNERIASSFLVRYDFNEITRRKLYTKAQIVDRLAEYYNVTKGMVFTAVANKKRKLHYCLECQRPIGGRQYQRNNGLCDRCVSRKIEISTKVT